MKNSEFVHTKNTFYKLYKVYSELNFFLQETRSSTWSAEHGRRISNTVRLDPKRRVRYTLN